MNRWNAFVPFVCVMLAACNSRLATHGPIDAGLAAFIPPDAVALADIRVEQLRSTPIYRKLAAQNRLSQFDQFRAEDIRELLLASDGKNVLAIARGAFQGKQSHPTDSATITIVDGNTALAGPEPVVRAAIGRYKSGTHDPPRSLMARVATLPVNAQIWAVVSGWQGLDPDTLRRMGNAANVDRMMRSVEGANLIVEVRGGLHAAFIGDCRTEAGAGSLTDSLRGLASLARIALTHNQPDMVRVFDAIQVRQEGRQVKMDIDIPQDLADKLSDKVKAGQ